MRRRADAVLLLAAGAALGVLGSLGVSKTADEIAEHRVAQDAAVVFCLSPAERGNLADAAVSLGLARRGPDEGEPLLVVEEALTPQEWRAGHGPDFKRVCDALVASRRSPRSGSAASGLLTTLGALLSVAFGAVLSGWRDAVARRRQEADALRTATQEFVRATRSLIRAWTAPGGPYPLAEETQVRERRGDLVVLLRRVAAAHPGWTVPLLRDPLSAGPLGEGLTQGWDPNDASTRAQRGRELEEELQRLDAAVGVIAQALEHPRRLHPALRGAVLEGRS